MAARESSLLHTASSSLSSLTTDNSFDEYFRPNRKMDPYFKSLDDNPEAMFDILTIQSLQERFSENDQPETKSLVRATDVDLITDQEFDNFVHEFPIDDSISECFASQEDAQIPQQIKKKEFVSHIPRPKSLKKKHSSPSIPNGNVIGDDEVKSSDSKKSKLIGQLFNRKGKTKDDTKHLENIKENNEFDSPVSKNIQEKQNQLFTSNKINKFENESERSESVSSNEKENIQETSFNGSSSNSDKAARKLPPLPRMKTFITSSQKKSKITPQESKYWFNLISNEEEDKIVQTLSSWPKERILSIRDSEGNSLLHRTALVEKTSVIRAITKRFPDMNFDLNFERQSPLEFAAYHGKLKSMMTLIEGLFGKVKGKINITQTTLLKLMEITANNGQSECLRFLLSLMDQSSKKTQMLPRLSAGNTIAHIAAKQGHTECLQVLIEEGYSRWVANDCGIHPMQLAIQNGHIICYQFLLLHETTTCLLGEAAIIKSSLDRSRQHCQNIQHISEQLQTRLQWYRKQSIDAIQTVIENQKRVGNSIDKIKTLLSVMCNHVDDQSVNDIREQLDNLQAEREIIQDSIEFSALADSDHLLQSVIDDFSKVILNTSSSPTSASSLYKIDPNFNLLATLTSEAQKSLATGIIPPNLVQNTIKTLLSTSTISSMKRNDTLSSKSRETSLPDKSRNIASENLLKKDDGTPQMEKLPNGHPNTNGFTTTENLYSQPIKTQQIVPADNKTPMPYNDIKRYPLNGKYPLKNSLTKHLSEKIVLLKEKIQQVHQNPFVKEQSIIDMNQKHSKGSMSVKWSDDFVSSDEDYNTGKMPSSKQERHLPSKNMCSNNSKHLVWKTKMDSKKDESTDSETDWWNALENDSHQKHTSYEGDEEDEDYHMYMSKKEYTHDNNKKDPHKKKNQFAIGNGNSNTKGKLQISDFKASNENKSHKKNISEFIEAYDRSKIEPFNRTWEDLSFSDREECRDTEKPWYEMSDDEESIINVWRSEDDDVHNYL